MNSEEQFNYDNAVKIYRYVAGTPINPQDVPFGIDYITGLGQKKLHRKSTIVKGECIKEEFFAESDGVTFTDLVVKEDTTYVRDTLGFPISKTVLVTWYKNDNTPHPTTKTWVKYYSQTEKIKEGEYRRSNLVAGIQTPMIGLISIAMLGHTNANMTVILEGRKFMAMYKSELDNFIGASNKEIIDCLNNNQHIKYATSSEFSWIDAMTPYQVTIRQYLIGELSI